MSIKILPIYFYPFSRTQNQILNKGNLFKQGLQSSLTYEDSINYQLNYRLGGALEESDRLMLDHSPDIKAHTPLGEMSFELDLSLDSFSTRLLNDPIIKNKTMYDIKMLVFFLDHTLDSEGKINKYFYYVDSVKRKNANVYTFTLALDVFKTYYEDVLEIDRLTPNRYFIESSNLHKTVLTDDDLILPYGNNHNIQLKTKSTWKKYNTTTPNDEIATTLWDYYYFKKKVSGYVIVPQLVAYNNIYVEQQEEINSHWQNHPSLIKVVRSIVPPNTNSIMESVDSQFFVQVVDSENGGKLYELGGGEFRINGRTWIRSAETLKTLVKEDIIPEGSNHTYFMIIENLRPYKDHDLLIGEYYSYLYNSEGIISVNFEKYINVEDYKNDIDQILNIELSIGFSGENKMSIPISEYKLDFITPQISIEHSLFQSQDTISFKELSSEVIINRNSELTNPRLSDSYETYILNNKNALIQKEKELNKYATRDTIVKGITATTLAAIGIAGAVFTGGTSLAMLGGAVGIGMAGYNTVEGLGKNARAKASHMAELEDKKGKIENFTTSNYNENMSFNRYNPILTTYQNVKRIYNDRFIEDMKDNPQKYYNIELYKQYGLKFYSDEHRSVKDMITREHYNYIEVADSTVAIQNGNIPNNLYNHVLEVLNNGMNYSSIDYILNNEIKNKEV